LELTPGTRIQAKLDTQISSAVQAPVVAVVEYTKHEQSPAELHKVVTTAQ
jgi:hypothetical protein